MVYEANTTFGAQVSAGLLSNKAGFSISEYVWNTRDEYDLINGGKVISTEDDKKGLLHFQAGVGPASFTHDTKNLLRGQGSSTLNLGNGFGSIDIERNHGTSTWDFKLKIGGAAGIAFFGGAEEFGGVEIKLK